MADKPAFAVVDMTEENPPGTPQGVRVFHLVVCYGDKEARVVVPAETPLYDRESKIEICQRSVQNLITALEAIAATPPKIMWNGKRQT